MHLLKWQFWCFVDFDENLGLGWQFYDDFHDNQDDDHYWCVLVAGGKRHLTSIMTMMMAMMTMIMTMKMTIDVSWLEMWSVTALFHDDRHNGVDDDDDSDDHHWCVLVEDVERHSFISWWSSQ